MKISWENVMLFALNPSKTGGFLRSLGIKCAWARVSGKWHEFRKCIECKLPWNKQKVAKNKPELKSHSPSFCFTRFRIQIIWRVVFNASFKTFGSHAESKVTVSREFEVTVCSILMCFGPRWWHQKPLKGSETGHSHLRLKAAAKKVISNCN